MSFRVVEAVEHLLRDAERKRWKIEQNGEERRLFEPAVRLGLDHVLSSDLSPIPQLLLAAGLLKEPVGLSLDVTCFPPIAPYEGAVTCSLSGKNDYGISMSVHYTDSEALPAVVSPSSSTVYVCSKDGHREYLSDTLSERPFLEQEKDALALITLARAALGLR